MPGKHVPPGGVLEAANELLKAVGLPKLLIYYILLVFILMIPLHLGPTNKRLDAGARVQLVRDA